MAGGRWPEAIALDHAVRRWGAETENAVRLSERENGVLTVIAILIGLGVFKVDDLEPRAPQWGYLTVLVAIGATGVLMLLALFRLLWIPSSREGTADGPIGTTDGSNDWPRVYASDHLSWPRDPELHPAALEQDREAYQIAYKRFTRAANSLNRRNIRRKEGIEFGQRFLFAAAICASFSIGAYPLLGTPQKPTKASTPLEQESSNGIQAEEG